MNRLVKKAAAVGLSVTTAVWLSGAALLIPVASAQLTVDELNTQIEALLATIKQLQADLVSLQGGAGVAVSCTFARNLTVGARGDDVQCLQRYLNSAGHQVAASGAGSPGNETTFFGPLTKAAAVKWQDANAASVLTPLGLSAGTGFWGPSSIGHYNSLAVAVPPPADPDAPDVPVPDSGLQLSLASDNPGEQTVGRGAASVVVLKFNVAGNGTLGSLIFKRVGIGATGDFESSGIYLYEGNNRLTSGRSINTTTHEVAFIALNLSVSGVRTLTLVVDTTPDGTAGNISRFELISAVGDPTPTGSLVGSDLRLAGQQVGGVHVATSSAPTNPKIGQLQAKVQEFQLAASSTEDILVRRISLTQAGSVKNDDIMNFTLKQAGNTLATVAAVGAKDLVTFVLDPALVIEKGQNKTFDVFADIGGGARVNETVLLYFDSKSDLEAIGEIYGFPVSPDIRNMDAIANIANVQIEGGAFTILFNGPIGGDIARRGSDVLLYDFTISSANNTEIRKLRIHTSSSIGDGSTNRWRDLKIWDVGENKVLTSAVDINATSTDTIFTDIISFSAGQTRRMKITADISSDTSSGDTIRMVLSAWQLGDIKNLDNNTDVALADIVPSTALAGNTHTVKAPELTVGLSASPSSQTYVQGRMDAPLAGYSFRAGGGDVRLDTLVITASSTTGALAAGEVTNLALWEGLERISTVKSLNTTLSTAGRTINFTGLNLTIPNGSTKLLTLRGNIDTSAGNTDVYYFYVASITSTDLTAYDTAGNTVSYAGVAANEAGAGAVRMTITTVGDVTVASAAADADTKADIILANGTEQILGKYVFSASNEDMTVRQLSIMINASSTSATATSTTTGDEVPWFNLYEGNTKIGGPYYPDIQGNSSSIVMITNFDWVIKKDTNQVLTIKGFVQTIGDGADTGATVAAHVLDTGFSAEGASNKDTTIAAASGNRKVVYKSRPTLSLVSPQPESGNGSLKAGITRKMLRFRVSADANGAIGWRQMTFRVTLTNASLAAVTGSNMVLRDLTTGDSLTLGTVYGGSGTASSGPPVIVGAAQEGVAYVGFTLTTPQEVAAGSSKDYDLELKISAISGTLANDSQAVVSLFRQETALKAASTYSALVNGTGTLDFATDMQPSFVWTDRSVLGAIATTTADWANSIYVSPSLFTDVQNALSD